MNLFKKKEGSSSPSLGLTIVKVFFGVVFIIVGFSEVFERGFGYLLVSLALGGSLIAWGVIPHIRARQALEEAEEQKRLEAEEVRQRELSKIKKCPACGAKTQGEKCEYCGHPLY